MVAGQSTMSIAGDILIPVELTPAEIERIIEALQFASEEGDESILAKFEAKLGTLATSAESVTALRDK